ncbi:hypothetical protein B0J14DRAFT_489576 [Halenospora varia]|nr:hypothetical protein B0J14DRAFT_489576 [Halenospora varia]
MSFLSKRSRSQRSFVRGEEQITVRKLQKSPQIDSQQCGAEGSTSSGGVDATDFALYDSCVLRNFPKHKSSHLRFLAWVAYTRKFTDEPITEDERRTSKRIFSKLGSKSSRNHPFPNLDQRMALAETSKSSKGMDDSDYPDIPAEYDAGPANEWGQLSLPEMANTSLRPSLELPDTQICEMSGSDCPLELSAGPETWLVPSYTAPQPSPYTQEPAARLVNPANRGPRPGIIEGRNPTAIVQVFAFTHIAYAFTIATEDNEMKVHTKEWFQDAMSWVEDLGSERQRNSYMQIANSIWQPANDLGEGDLPRLFGLADQGNRLFLACKRFLDVLESFGFSDADSGTAEKAFDFAQPLFARKAQSHIIDELIKTTSIEAFIEDVVKVEKRLDRGHITTIRELELELMCAGKVCHSHHKSLCNTLYVSPARERSVYYMRDISLIKRLLPEELYGDHHGEEERDFELELDDDLPLDFDIGALPRCDGKLVENVHNFMRDADQLMSGPRQQEKWKASNLRRHKRTQHAKKGEYICKWLDCGRAFTRSDNLRSHMRDKGHETNPKSKGKGKERAVEVYEDESDDSEVARHSEAQDGDERGAKRRRKA